MKAMQARDIPACIKFQGDYIQDMIDESGYIHNVTHKILNEWFENRLKSGVCGYRNYSHTSIFTQRQGVKPKVNFMKELTTFCALNFIFSMWPTFLSWLQVRNVKSLHYG